MERYDLMTNFRCGSSIEEMEPSEEGEWVRWEDVEEDVQHALATITIIKQERDQAVTARDRAWAAATDDTFVGFHRDMALRLSEDRDTQKHLARQAESQLTSIKQAIKQIEREIRQYANESSNCGMILQSLVQWADRLAVL